MTDHFATDDLRILWQSQTTEPPKVRPEDFRRKLNKFERRVFWRNLREYAAGAVVTACFGYFGWTLHGLLVRVGAGLVVAGTLTVMFELHRRGSMRTAPADLGLSTCIDFHRKSLERQRDALRTVLLWYLLPVVPGLATFDIGSAINRWKAHPVDLQHFVLTSLVSPAIVAAVFIAVWRLNQWAAGKLQKRIDELTALGK